MMINLYFIRFSLQLLSNERYENMRPALSFKLFYQTCTNELIVADDCLLTIIQTCIRITVATLFRTNHFYGKIASITVTTNTFSQIKIAPNKIIFFKGFFLLVLLQLHHFRV